MWGKKSFLSCVQKAIRQMVKLSCSKLGYNKLSYNKQKIFWLVSVIFMVDFPVYNEQNLSKFPFY
jgi:hypothetical protein